MNLDKLLWLDLETTGLSPEHGHILRLHMPSVLEKLHYRNFDVSTLKILAELKGIELPPKREVHRAIPDLEDAIALGRIALGWAR